MNWRPGRWELLRLRVDAWWEVMRLCRRRGQHHVKMGSRGHCYRCGKRVA